MNSATPGQRVKLLHTSDPYTDLEPDALGTIDFVDDMGTVHVKWDNGSNLGLIPREDFWEDIDENRIRTIRVHDNLWHAAQRMAASRDETVTAAVTRFLRYYVTPTPHEYIPGQPVVGDEPPAECICGEAEGATCHL